MPTVSIQNITLCEPNSPLLLIAGPCVIESLELCRIVAAEVKRITQELGLSYIFKASFDKANRTSGGAFRGQGMEKGLEVLQAIKSEFGVPVLTDVHETWQCKPVAEVCDVLQIPAFLCRQTDLIVAAAETGRAINVKKGQFLAPWDVRNIGDKLASVGCQNFMFTERGTTFGYNNLVADMRSLYWMRELGYRVVMDATHSVQRPGGLGTATGGDGKLAPVLARAAVATGCDGVFMETHPDPAKAFSDGPNQIPLSQIAEVVETLRKIHGLVRDIT